MCQLFLAESALRAKLADHASQLWLRILSSGHPVYARRLPVKLP